MTAPAPVIDDMLSLIAAELALVVAEKGEALPRITSDSVFLGGGLPVDSLDLATLLVVLERKLGVDPFREGFRQFTTAGELATIYAEAIPAEAAPEVAPEEASV